MSGKALIAVAMAVGLLGLAACGGGGGGGGGGSSSSGATSITVTLSASSGSASVTEGATAASLATTATATGPVPASAVADLQYDKTVFSTVTATAGAGGSYAVSLQTLPNLAGGEYKGTVNFRLCQDTSCANVYAGSAVSYTYDIIVSLQDWTTFQRDAGHRGYVHTSYDSTKFTKLWAWTDPAGNPSGAINAAVTGGNAVYVTSSTGKVYKIDEQSGTSVWSYDASANMNSIGSAAYDNGTIYVPTFDFTSSNGLGNEYGVIWGIDASTGLYKNDYSFAAQWSSWLSPTLYKSVMYFSAGYYGGQVYAYSTTKGTQTWLTSGGGGNAWDRETPAVDDKYVYYYDGTHLEVYNVADGSAVEMISDPNATAYTYSYGGAPIVGSSGDVLALSGTQEQIRKITRFNIATGTVAWGTANGYKTTPAIAGGVIYAARNSPGIVDAINEADGTVAWSWPMPAGNSTFTGNLVVTDNLLFVCTDKNVYAIDLTTHQSVWSYAATGALTISANNILYVASNPGTLTAIKLK